MPDLQPAELPQEAPETAKKAGWRKLETLAHVRLALASVIKRTYDGKLDPLIGGTCIKGLRALSQTLKESELEERLKRIEAMLGTSH